MIAVKEKRSKLYSKSAKDLHPLSEQQKVKIKHVFVQVNPQLNRWTPAVVTRMPVASQPRSYSLETSDGAQLQRNRRFIPPAAPVQTGSTPVATKARSSPQNPLDCKPETACKERPTRMIKKPERLIQFDLRTFFSGETLHYNFSLISVVRTFNL